MSEAGELTEKHSRGGRRNSRQAPPPPHPPLPRLGRERAEEASLRAELDVARRKADLERERAVSMALARLLARRDRQRDEAATLALRAIRIRDDADLRREVAEWLESLGEPALAAAVLGPLANLAATADAATPGQAVSILARIALLYARAGDAEGAVDALEEAAELEPSAALPLELRGAIAGWAPEALAPSEAADAFARAAERRAAAGSDPFEDLLRAFETDATSDIAANALADALAGRGKRLAADEVRREHGRALRGIDRSRAAEVHRRRRVDAVEQGAVARALGAALDEAWARGEFASSDIEIEELLARAGLAEAFAHREALFDPDGLVKATEGAPTNVRPVLLCFAAEICLERGERERARDLAQKACDIEPNYPRSAASLAAAVLDARDAKAATAVERAIRLVCARGVFCRALSAIHEALGSHDISVAWSQHTVALRPGDREALERWFHGAIQARDPARLGDAISWAVAQPQPASMLAGLVAQGLRALVDLDVDRAAVLARRALDAFGPHRSSLRESIELVAERANDDALAAALLERFVSAGAKADDRPTLLVRLAGLRSRLGDGDGEAIAYARALRESLDPNLIADRALVLRERVRTSDGLLAALEVEARVAQASGDRLRAWEALRHYGAALSELAGDLRAAAAVWTLAAKCLPQRGPRIIASDLREAGGHEGALVALLAVLETEVEPHIAGVLAEEASRCALSAGQPARALALAKMALEKMPDHTDALEMAELGAAMDGRPADVSPIYEAVARRALGKYGRRSAHFRAARYFERQELYFLALHHAAEAFGAVPSEGALALLRRIAERAGDRAAAVRAVVGVAEAARSKEVRSGWLSRAAELAGNDEDGARQRVDILLRGAVASPDRATLARLGTAIHRLLELAPFEREGLSLRVGNAARMLTARAEGPDGARVAIELARLAIGAFGDANGAVHALERALNADADLEEYEELEPFVGPLSARADKLLPAAIAIATKPYSNIGAPALRLLVAIAKAGEQDVAERELQALLTARLAPAAPQETLDFSDSDENGPTPAQIAEVPGEVAPPESPVAEAQPTPEDASPRASSKPGVLELVESVPPMPAAAPAPQEDVAEAVQAGVAPEAVQAGVAPEAERDLETLALEAARDTTLAPGARAERLSAVAAAREARGELGGAADALLEAASLEPRSLERWRAAWTLAQEANRKDQMVAALQQIELLVDGGERTRVLRQLARRLQEIGRADEAAAAWNRLLLLLPDDEEADQGVEIIVSEARDYERLAAHLADRVSRLSRHEDRRDSIRAAKLRRAAILEQRLDRAEEACSELEALLRDAPENESALRYLADLYERRGEFERAASLLRRLAELARGPQTRNDLGFRAAFALRDAGDLRSALVLVKTLLEREPDLDGMALHVEIARALEDDHELGAALERAASTGRHEATIAAEMWVESAQAAARIGDATLALARAQRGVESDPTSAEAQLFARGLEYRRRGAGDAAEAQETVAQLDKIAGELANEDVALAAFLRAEALVVLGRKEEAKNVLAQTVDRVGAHPLLSLATAERLLDDGHREQALTLFEQTVDGELFGFRSRGAVAMLAAKVAASLDRREDLIRLLRIGAQDEATKAEATAELDRLIGFGPSVVAPTQTSSPEPASVAPNQRDTIDDHTPPKEDASPIGMEGMIEPPSRRASSIPPSVRIAELERAVYGATSPADKEHALLALAQANRDMGAPSAAEAALEEALSSGSMAAGDELASWLVREGRDRDLVRVRLKLSALSPGDATRLEDLRVATLADKNTVHARAIEHVLRAFDVGAVPLPPPPLVVQREQPGTLGLVVRAPWSPPLAEAFALVHEHGVGLFARELATYSLTGLEHVVPGPTSGLSRVLEVALRLLEAPALHLYAKRSNETPTARAILLDTAAALIQGDVREETVHLRYALGQAIAAAQPENLLLGGLEEHDGRALWDAVVGAFGPAERSTQLSATSGRYAGALWERLPPRAQRRMQELLGGVRPLPSYDELRETVRQSARRLGLFLAGNVAAVVRIVAIERGLEPDRVLSEGGLVSLANDAAVADLLRLAVTPAYADARWQPLTPGSRGARQSGHFPAAS